MTTIHVSQAEQMQATVLVRHYLPFLKEQKMCPNHQSGAHPLLLPLDFQYSELQMAPQRKHFLAMCSAATPAFWNICTLGSE